MTKKKIDPTEVIMNLLIIKLLLDDVDIKLIEKATGLDEKTIYARFPMKLIKQTRANTGKAKVKDLGRKSDAESRNN